MKFDPEFADPDPGLVCHQNLKNANDLLHFEIADAGISPTKWQAGTYPEHFRKKITIVHDGVDTKALAPNPKVGICIKKGLTLFKSDPVVTFVNRNLEPHRGYHIFMRALPEILKRNPRARTLIIGGNQTSYHEKPPQGTTWMDIFLDEVKDRLDMSRVHFLGRLPYEHYIGVMQLSTVHVYLTYPFVLSWSLVEAMSMGCSIVASDTAPVQEVIEHDQTGRLVNFFDIQGIADNVTELLDNPNERQRLGANAREFAVKHYDLQTKCLPKQIEWVEGLMI